MAICWAFRGSIGRTTVQAARLISKRIVGPVLLRKLPIPLSEAHVVRDLPIGVTRAYASGTDYNQPGDVYDVGEVGAYQPQASEVYEGTYDGEGVNSVRLTGNLGREPFLAGGTAGRSFVATFALAISQGKREQQKPPIWMEVEAWGGLAESAAARLRKGDKVRVEGRLVFSQYNSRDGVLKEKLRVRANALYLIPRGGGQPYQQDFAPQQQQQPAPYNPVPPQPYTTPMQPMQPPQQDTGYYAGAPGPQQQSYAPQQQDVAPQYQSYAPQQPGGGFGDQQGFAGPPQQGGGGAWMPEYGESPKENSWIQLFRDYSSFWDNRGKKAAGMVNPNRPDFSFKDRNREEEFPALWITDKMLPDWVKNKLHELPDPPMPPAQS